MGFLDLFRRPPPILTLTSLADFLDTRAAFLVQKGIYEYARARAGYYAKSLFVEKPFLDLVERARWQAYPLGLAIVAEVVESVLRPYAGEDRRPVLDAITVLALSIFDRYPVPEAIGEDGWMEARTELAKQLDRIGTHAPKPAKDIPNYIAEAYFALMPIHEKLRGRDFNSIRSYLRVSSCNIHDEFTKRADLAALSAALRASSDGAD
jgi:hypothetical protein